MNAADFWQKVSKTDTCWLWTGTKDRLGYGRISMHLDGTPVQLAHRAAFILETGTHPPALDHLCRNPSCVRPSHLDPCGQAENARRQVWPTYCPKGHEFTAANTRRVRNAGGYLQRVCRECTANIQRRYRAARSA